MSIFIPSASFAGGGGAGPSLQRLMATGTPGFNFETSKGFGLNFSFGALSFGIAFEDEEAGEVVCAVEVEAPG
ncbi:MAG: hypothetical protein WCF22_22885 [Candidatus Sulfotelmatobacter sp.]